MIAMATNGMPMPVTPLMTQPAKKAKPITAAI